MSQFHIRPSSLTGTISIPPSKSHTLRAVLFAAMAHGRSYINGFLHSPDTTAMIHAMRQFGAHVEISETQLQIDGVAGKLTAAENIIDSGNSGQVLRFVGALAGLCPAYTVLTGDHSIRHNRPIQPLLTALSQLGALAVSTRLDGYAPVIIKGPIQPGHVRLPGEDSQPVSGLLIALSFLPGNSLIEVANPGEKPWIDLTLHWLKKFHISIEHKNYSLYSLPGYAKIEGFHLTIPGDFSSAAFPLVAALVTHSELTLSNLDMHDCQGDKKLIEILIQMGANIEIDDQNKTLIVRKSSLRGCRIDVNDFIDATPILAVVGCFAQGQTEITNASIARKKESDRLHAMTTELRKMGAKIEERPDGLVISHSPLHGASVFGWHDHRVAMSLSVAALAAQGESLIDGVECIAKTYPSFGHDFRALGAKIESRT
jgi:3-phosphoshikimate 1-carboxyvinyltransferase